MMRLPKKISSVFKKYKYPFRHHYRKFHSIPERSRLIRLQL